MYNQQKKKLKSATPIFFIPPTSMYQSIIMIYDDDDGVYIQTPYLKLQKSFLQFFCIVCYQTTHLSLHNTEPHHSIHITFFYSSYTLPLHFLFTHPPTIIALI